MSKKTDRLQLTPEHLAALDAAMDSLEARYEEILARTASTSLPDASQELTLVRDGEPDPQRWLTRDGLAQAQDYVDTRLEAQAELRALAEQSRQLVERMRSIEALLGEQVLAGALRAHAVLDQAGLAGDLRPPEELSGEVVAFPGKGQISPGG